MTAADLDFRPADPAEADVLWALTLRSLGHWGHPENFPELIAQMSAEDAITDAYIRDNDTWVLASADGAPVGYYGLKPIDDGIDLTYMFLEPEAIGGGLGRRMWDHAVARARTSGKERMRIISDPMSIGFYATMGAELERKVALAPDFELGVMWLPLTDGDAAG